MTSFEFCHSQTKKETGPAMPKYKGPWAPNRYQIPPGHRWDGVGTFFSCFSPSLRMHVSHISSASHLPLFGPLLLTSMVLSTQLMLYFSAVSPPPPPLPPFLFTFPPPSDNLPSIGPDRGTGFESKWFQNQNAKKRLANESYAWGSEDM